MKSLNADSFRSSFRNSFRNVTPAAGRTGFLSFSQRGAFHGHPSFRTSGQLSGRQRGFTLVSAVIGVALITGLIVFMLSLSVHFHRINRESLSGTQMEMVLDAIVNAYVWQRQQSPLRKYYHVTNAGILPAGEYSGSGSMPLPPPPDVLWVDTIEVSVWQEDIGHGVRTWGVCTSQRSRRGSSTVYYSPKLD